MSDSAGDKPSSPETTWKLPDGIEDHIEAGMCWVGLGRVGYGYGYGYGQEVRIECALVYWRHKVSVYLARCFSHSMLVPPSPIIHHAISC